MSTATCRNCGVGGTLGFSIVSSDDGERGGRAVSCAKLLLPILSSQPMRARAKRACVYCIANPPPAKMCVCIKYTTFLQTCYEKGRLDLSLSLAYPCPYGKRC